MVSYKKRIFSFILCLCICFSLAVAVPLNSHAVVTELTATALLAGSAVVAACLVALGFTYVNESSISTVFDRIKNSSFLSPFLTSGGYFRCMVDPLNKTYVPQEVVQAVSDATYQVSDELISSITTSTSSVGVLSPNTTYSLSYSDFVAPRPSYSFYIYERYKNSGGTANFYYYRPNVNSTLTVKTDSSGRVYSLVGSNWDMSSSNDFSSSYNISINFTSYTLSRQDSYVSNGSTFYHYYYFYESGTLGYSSYSFRGLEFYAGFLSTVTNTVSRSLNVSARTAIPGSITASGQPVAVTDWANDSVSYDDAEYLPLTVPASPSAVLTASQADMQVGDTSLEVVEDGIYEYESDDKEPGFFPPIQPWLNRVKRKLDEMGVSPSDFLDLVSTVFRSVLVTIQQTLDIVVDGIQDFDSRLQSLPSFFSLFDPNNTDGLFYMPESSG